jgi:diguanylate cyclase (GGDEF)-like protein
MRQQEKSEPLTSRITVPVIIGAALSLALVVAFGVYAVLRVDGLAVERQRNFARSGIAEQVDGLAREQRSVTLWNDSVLKAKAGDQQWMRENLGEWLHSYYGQDRVYVLDERNRPIHAMRDGMTVDPASFGGEAGAIMPLVARLRTQMRQRSAEPGITDLVRLGSVPAIVSVQPIMPDTELVRQEAGTEYVHVASQLVDAELVSRVAAHYLIEGARLTSIDPQTTASVPLLDSGNATLGFLTWEPDRPGLAVVTQTAPALLAGVLLGAAVLGFILRRLRRASRELQSSEEDARYLAFHDTLTELPNRALFEDRLDQALATVRRGRGRMALLCVDLDRFKHVNDTLGHDAGDQLVKQVAERLGEGVREIDTVARVGGDEFAIVLVDIRDQRTAEKVSERILADLGEPFDIKGDQIFISASIGIALSPQDGIDVRELFRKADIALYAAKRSGRSCFRVFSDDMDDTLKHKHRIERDLRQALEGSRPVELAYQPVFAMDGLTLLGAEATLDSDHFAHGGLPVSQLIAIAEERGVIGLLTERMLAAACAFARDSEVPWLSIALSPVFLRQEGAAQLVQSVLAEAGVTADRLQVEIGEGLLLDGNPAALAAVRALREAGVRIALDDFGTGPSSLTLLRLHRVDKLKIDRSFVRLLGGSDPGEAIVRAIAQLAAALGIGVAAEGVETPEQRTTLAALGCQEIQGSLLSPPMPAARFARMARLRPALRSVRSAG